MGRVFDPYHKWLGVPPEEQPPSHYRLLGLKDLEADPDVIQAAADQRMAHLRTYQTGQYADWSQRLLNEVATARICLLNPDRKAAYDQQLQDAKQAAMQLSEPEPAPQSFALVVDAPLPKASSALRPKTGSPLGTLITGAVTLVVALLLGLVYWNASPTERSNAVARSSDNSAAIVRESAKPPDVDAGQKTRDNDVGKAEEHNNRSVDNAEEAVATSVDAVPREGPAPRKTEEPKLVIKPTAKPPETIEDETSRESDAGQSDLFPEATSVPSEEPSLSKAGESSESTESELMPTGRVDEPAADAQEEAMKLARELYKEEFIKAKTADEKLALAKKLLAQAEAATTADAGTFVLLRLAKDIALQASNGETSFAAIDLMAERFRIDALGMKTELLASHAKKAKSPPQHLSIAEQASRLLDDALAADDYTQAMNLAKLTSTEAAAGRNKELVQWAKNCLPELQKKGKLVADFKTAEDVLAGQPDDASANLSVGAYYAYVQGNWEKALPYFAKSNDADLQPLAKRELRSPPNAVEAQMALADAWWDAGQDAEGTKRLAILRHAGSWYAQSHSEALSGLNKVKVEKRLEELAKVDHDATRAGAGPKLAVSIGKWFSLLPNANELIGWDVAECNYTYSNRIIDLRRRDLGCPIVVKDASIRAKVRRQHGSTVRLILRASEQGCYIAQLTSSRWSIIKTTRTPMQNRDAGWGMLWGEEDTLNAVPVTRNYGDVVFEMGFAVQGTTLTAFLNRQPVVQAQDATLTEGVVGIGTTESTGLYLTDIELLISNKGSLVEDRRRMVSPAKVSSGR